MTKVREVLTRVGILFIIFGFGSLVLRSFNYSFTLISWLDDSQPAAGIIIGVVGVVMVVAGLLIKSAPQKQPNVPNPGQQPGGAPWPGQQAPGQQPAQGQQQGGARWPGQQAPGQQPAQGQQQGGAPWPGQQEASQQGLNQQNPSQQAAGQNSSPQFGQRPQSPQQFNGPQSGQFPQPPQSPDRH